MTKIVEKSENRNIHKIAVLVSISCVLQIAESLIPHPVPGLRLGLANVMILIALDTLDFKSALEVAVLRTILSSLVMGTFLSPAFILSFCGALVGTLVMGFFYWLSKIKKYFPLSIVGISIIGALSHTFVQIYLAYFILIRHNGILMFLPWLSIGALFMGWLTGAAAGNICLKIKDTENPAFNSIGFTGNSSGMKVCGYYPGTSFIHRMPSQIKIAGLIILSLAVLIFCNYRLYIILSLFLAVIAFFSGVSFNFLSFRIKKCGSLIFASFFVPLFFNSGSLGGGLNAAILFGFRIVFLIIAGSLLIRTTSFEEMNKGLAKLLLPLNRFGFSNDRAAAILSLSWIVMPLYAGKAKDLLVRINLRIRKKFYNPIPVISDFITALYLESINTKMVGCCSLNRKL